MRILEWLHHPTTYVFALISLVVGIGTIDSLRGDPVDLTRFGPETSGLIVSAITFASLIFIRIVLVAVIAFLRRLPYAPPVGSAAKAVQDHAEWSGRSH